MSDSPVVSVCIASYNHARFLPRCLDSILAQTYRDFEIVVVDDGSKDESDAVLCEYQQRYPEKIRYTWHPGRENRGISATTNAAIRNSNGKYIAFIGSDDAWYPGKLERQVALLEEHSDYGYVYSYAHFIDEDDRLLPGLYGVDITHDANPTGRMILSCHQPAMTVILRRSFLDKIEWFDESLVYSDWDLMLRMTALWPAGFIDQPLARYRIHGKNTSKRIDPNVDLKRILDFTQAIQRKSKDVGGGLEEPRNQSLLSLQLCFLYFCLGDEKIALENLDRAFDVDPSIKDNLRFLDGWLNQWKPDYYTTDKPHFGLWFTEHLPATLEDIQTKLYKRQVEHPETQEFFVKRGIERGRQGFMVDGIFNDIPRPLVLTKAWITGIKNHVYPALLFEAQKKGDQEQVRKFWLATVRYDFAWLFNRGVLAIGFRAFVPLGLVGGVREIIRISRQLDGMLRMEHSGNQDHA